MMKGATDEATLATTGNTYFPISTAVPTKLLTVLKILPKSKPKRWAGWGAPIIGNIFIFLQIAPKS